jgi:hypothetical protein
MKMSKKKKKEVDWFRTISAMFGFFALWFGWISYRMWGPPFMEREHAYMCAVAMLVLLALDRPRVIWRK